MFKIYKEGSILNVDNLAKLKEEMDNITFKFMFASIIQEIKNGSNVPFEIEKSIRSKYPELLQ